MSAADVSSRTVSMRDGKHPHGLVDADVVAKHLNVPLTWVYAEARAGRLPSVRLGRYVRFRLSAVEAWLADLESGAKSPYRRYSPAVPGHRPGGSSHG